MSRFKNNPGGKDPLSYNGQIWIYKETVRKMTNFYAGTRYFAFLYSVTEGWTLKY